MDSESGGNKRTSAKFYRLKVASVSRVDETTKRLLTYNVDLDDGPTSSRLNVTLTVILKGIWVETQLYIDSIVHVIQPHFDEESHIYTVDNATGLLVLEPDHQISCTTIATSLFCERKSWLNQIFLNRVGTHPDQLVGIMVHDILLHALKHQVEGRPELLHHLDEILCAPSIMMEIFATGKHSSYYRDEVVKYLDNIQEWICKYVHSGSKNSLKNNQHLGVRLKEIHDIENLIQSTTLGLRGKVDLNGTVRIYDRRTKRFSDMFAAMEIKSGVARFSLAHSAQVNLYTMILDDIHQDCERGFVTYLRDETDMYEINTNQNVKRDLIHRRNQLATDLTNPFVGPRVLDRLTSCQPCEKLTECLLTERLYEDKLKQYPNMICLESEALDHLDSSSVQFFKRHYERFIKLRNACQARAVSLEDFELIGEGFCRLKLHVGEHHRRDLLIFRRHPAFVENYISRKRLKTTYSQPTIGGDDDDYDKASPLKMQLRPFDTRADYSMHRVLVRPDQERQAGSIGIMQEINEHRLVVRLFNRQQVCQLDTNLVYRIDKVFPERDSRLNTMRRVLSKLVERQGRHAVKVRRLVADPNYEAKYNSVMRSTIDSSGNEQLFELKAGRQEVIAHAVSTETYHIISERDLESPADIRQCVELILAIISSTFRLSTLVVGQNVDHLMDLMRALHDNECPFVLVDDGKSLTARRQFAKHLIGSDEQDAIEPRERYEQFLRHYELAPVVVTTYSAVASKVLFTRRFFDYCLAYDCDKTDVLVGLAPLFCSDRHILIDVRLPAETKRPGPFDKSASSNHEDDILSLGDHLRALGRLEISRQSGVLLTAPLSPTSSSEK